MIRPLTWLWHQTRGNRWMRRAERMARQSREAFIDNRISAERARAHFARADELYPPPARGPPITSDSADGVRAAAQRDGPQIR
ncbi:hypothetical protein [Methylobacterium fujisawaense]|uniref:hypothetical protein n=1 Tax=Methylobacterium fujisawaense TaxID=107400 RepID=UPI00313DAF33